VGAQGVARVSFAPTGLHLFSADGEAHWACDVRGHLLAGHTGDAHYQVGLGGDVLVKRGHPGDYALSRLPAQEAEALFDMVAAQASEALVALARDELALSAADGSPQAAQVHSRLEAVARRDASACRADREAFAAVYRPVRILPPDNYRALLVQLTEGCSHNRCTFCTLYRDVPFRVKTPDDLGRHLDGIQALLGAALDRRTQVFLGDANACLVPQRRLLPAMARIAERFPGPARGGFHAFVDAFTPPGKSEAELVELTEAGLRRLTVGLETGHAPLLAWLDKPGTPDDVVAAVGRFKEAGLKVSVTVLVGAGGERYARAHREDTLRVIERLGLERGDRVYVSPFRPQPGTPYAERAQADGVAPFSEAALLKERRVFQEALAGDPFQVVLYDVERWIY
jgi:radical SAM superfamily enzyme YgiQ (UPF0313 family)